MTFKERLEIEHPECVDDDLHAGCVGCPHAYGYETREESRKNCGDTCEKCWNREIPVDEFKPGDKVKLRKGLKVECEYDGIVLLRGMSFDDIGIVVEKNIRGNYEVLVSHSFLPYIYSPVMLEKAEEREEKKMKFKVGDKVRTTKLMDYAGNELFPVGTIGRVAHVSISEREKLPYRIEVNSNTFWYSEDMLEKVDFSKDDLKNGMVIEYRDGRRRIVLNEGFCGIDSWTDIETHENDLTYRDHDLDVMKVFSGKATTIKELLEHPGKLIWERKEEPITKDVSLEELNTILKEKFPDVDKFNLPIEE